MQVHQVLRTHGDLDYGSQYFMIKPTFFTKMVFPPSRVFSQFYLRQLLKAIGRHELRNEVKKRNGPFEQGSLQLVQCTRRFPDCSLDLALDLAIVVNLRKRLQI